MGRRYRGACPKCDYEASFPLGFGLFSIEPLRFIDQYPVEEQAAIRTLYENGEVQTGMSRNMLVRCPNCPGEDNLKVKPIVELTDRQGQSKTFGTDCSECGSPLEVLSERQVITEGKEVLCPKCGVGHLTFQSAGLWD